MSQKAEWKNTHGPRKTLWTGAVPAPRGSTVPGSAWQLCEALATPPENGNLLNTRGLLSRQKSVSVVGNPGAEELVGKDL